MHGSNILTRYNIQCKVNNGDLVMCTLNFGYIRGTSQHGTNMCHKGLLSPTCFNWQFFIIKWSSNSKNMIFQSWKEHTFIYKQAKMFEDHHESNNIHPTSAEEFRQSCRLTSKNPHVSWDVFCYLVSLTWLVYLLFSTIFCIFTEQNR